MSGPYREAFVELAQDIFNTVKALGEDLAAGLAAEAEKRDQQFRDIVLASKHHDRFENAEKLVLHYCSEFRMRFKRWTRCAWDRYTILDVYLECGHRASYQIDDMMIEAGHVEDVVDYLTATLRDGPHSRRCSCVLRDREAL